MYLFNSWIVDFSRMPGMIICCSFSCLATWKDISLKSNITLVLNLNAWKQSITMDLHLWHRFPTILSTSWRRTRKIQAWRRRIAMREWDPPGYAIDFPGEKGSNRDHQQGTHVLALHRVQMARHRGCWPKCSRRTSWLTSTTESNQRLVS